MLILAGVAVLVGAWSPAAHAQDRREEARAVFQRGMDAANAQRWQEALVNFERAYELVPRPEILLNIATAHVELGQVVAGAEAYQRFLAAVPDSPLEGQARTALAEAETRIARLRIVLRGGEAEALQIDGRAVQNDGTTPLRVDPGPHTITIVAGGERTEREISIGAGESMLVEIDVASATVTAEPEPDTESTPPPVSEAATQTAATAPDDSGGGLSGLAIAGIVGTGVGLATFGVAGALALVEHSDLREACGDAGTCEAGATDTVTALTITADVGLGVALVGAVLFVIGLATGEGPQQPDPQAVLRF